MFKEGAVFKGNLGRSWPKLAVLRTLLLLDLYPTITTTTTLHLCHGYAAKVTLRVRPFHRASF